MSVVAAVKDCRLILITLRELYIENCLVSGFSRINGKTWLPVNPNYYHLNVECQKRYATSHFNIYKALVKLRTENEVFQKGDFEMTPITEWVLSFKRYVP